MRPRPTSSSNATILNPRAPEYTPIPPGIYPPPPPPYAATAFFQFPPPSPFYAPHQPYIHISSNPYVNQNYNYTYYISVQPQNNTALSNLSNTSTTNHVSTAANITATRQVQPSKGFSDQTIVGPRAGGRGRAAGFRHSAKDKQNCSISNIKDGSDKLCYRRGVEINRAQQRNRSVLTPLVRGEQKTTVMIKNIPYACPRWKLMRILDGFCMSENGKVGNQGNNAASSSSCVADDADQHDYVTAYDFLYLPFDFVTENSRGFAFVNFTNPRAALKLYDTFQGEKWDIPEWSNWPKRIEIVSAKIQGKEALVNNFKGSIFQCETNEFLPVCFDPARDGTQRRVQFTVIGNRKHKKRFPSLNKSPSSSGT